MKNYKYYKIAEEIIRYIKDSHLPCGSKLPGIRVFAKKLGVSKNTVIKAFEYLSDQEYIEIKEKTGAYVAWGAWFEEDDELWSRFRSYDMYSDANMYFIKHFTSVTPERIPTGTAMLSEEFSADTYISYALKDTYRLVLKEHLSNRLAELASTKKAVCEYLGKKGIFAEPDTLLLTAGVPHAIHVILMTLLSRGMYLLITAPSSMHMNAQYFSAATGANVVHIGMDSEGIDVSQLQKLQYRKNAVLVISSVHQCPTGITMSGRRKQELISACKDLHIPIIEADYFSDCINADSIKTMDKTNNMIYCGTIRHNFALGLNVGWLVVPKHLYARVKDKMSKINVYRDNISHAILESLLSNGYYYSFLKNSMPLFNDRVDLTNRLLDEYLYPNVSWERKDSRFYYWLNFKDIDTQALFTDLDEFVLTEGRLFSDSSKDYLSFCPMSLTEEELLYFIQTVSVKIKKLSPA